MKKLSPANEFQTRETYLEKSRKSDLATLQCPECSSRFFEQITVAKYQSDHVVVLGQEVPIKKGGQRYKMLRCVHCQEMIEPRVLSTPRDMMDGDYGELLDTLEGKVDSRKPKTPKNEIPIDKC